MSGKVHPDKMTKKQLEREVREARRQQEIKTQGYSGVHPCVNSCTKCGCTATACGCGIAAACGSGCNVMGGRKRKTRRRRRTRSKKGGLIISYNTIIPMENYFKDFGEEKLKLDASELGEEDFNKTGFITEDRFNTFKADEVLRYLEYALNSLIEGWPVLKANRKTHKPHLHEAQMVYFDGQAIRVILKYLEKKNTMFKIKTKKDYKQYNTVMKVFYTSPWETDPKKMKTADQMIEKVKSMHQRVLDKKKTTADNYKIGKFVLDYFLKLEKLDDDQRKTEIARRKEIYEKKKKEEDEKKRKLKEEEEKKELEQFRKEEEKWEKKYMEKKAQFEEEKKKDPSLDWDEWYEDNPVEDDDDNYSTKYTRYGGKKRRRKSKKRRRTKKKKRRRKRTKKKRKRRRRSRK